MSLTTGGGLGGAGGAGGGGLVLGHDASGAMSNMPPAAPPVFTGHASPPGGGSGAGPGGSGIAIEVCDKTQKLTLSKARSVAHLPICAVDLHATKPTVAFFPPVVDSNSGGGGSGSGMLPVFLGKMKSQVCFQATEASHKVLRKYLTQTKPYSALKHDCLVTSATTSATAADTTTTAATATTSNVVVLDRPHVWLGIRRIPQLPQAWQAPFTIAAAAQSTTTTQSTSTTTTAIAQEDFAGTNCCWWTNSTLDGSFPDPARIDHDMDRVVAKVRLHSNKKALTILPEEATQLLLHQARSHVVKQFQHTAAATTTTTNNHKKQQDKQSSSQNNTAAPAVVDDSCVTTLPLAIAVPSWAMNDASMEALYEAAEGGIHSSDTTMATVLFPRTVSALIGSFVKPSMEIAQNKFLQRIATVQQALLHQHKQQQHHSHQHQQHAPPFEGTTLILVMGTTPEGCEVTAISCSYPEQQRSDVAIPFQEFRVLANVSDWIQNITSTTTTSSSEQQQQQQSPASLLANCLLQLEQVLEMVAPDADGPAALLSFGTTLEQDELAQALKQHIKTNNNKWLEKVPLIAASPEAVPTGAAYLGGIALGRCNTDSSELPVKLHSSAMVATGIARYYTTQQLKQAQQQQQTNNNTNNTNSNNNNIKVIFDFDRRLPAGPYGMEFKASECVVHRQKMATASSSSVVAVVEEDEAFLKAVKDAETAKLIPEREKAALEFHVQVFQKYTRKGEWHAVGNPITPLIKYDTQIDPETDEDLPETKIACEQAVWELSMTVFGTLASAWVGERESVVQAVKSARGRLYEYYGWMAFCILFFGGFFAKSYWEDYVWKRDTAKLLDYYKHVIPGSIQDGDKDTASWMAYKYRNNKAKLWHNLEQKYGVPVPDSWDEYILQQNEKKKKAAEEEAAAAAAATESDNTQTSTSTTTSQADDTNDDHAEVDLDNDPQQQEHKQQTSNNEDDVPDL